MFFIIEVAEPPPMEIVEPSPATEELPDGRDDIVVVASRASSNQMVIVQDVKSDPSLSFSSLDLLNAMPGVRAVSTGGAGGNSFVSIRGGEPNYAQVMIEGIRVSNPSNSAGGGFDFAQLAPNVIDRIEVVPTGRSAIHGSDALSGVINLMLLQPERRGAQVELISEGDSREAWSLSGIASSGWADGEALLSAGYADSGDLTKGSSLERWQLLAKGQQQMGPVSGSAFLIRSETDRSGFPESSGGPIYAANRELEQRNSILTVAGASFRGNEGANITPSIRLGYSREEMKISSPAIYPGVLEAVPALESDGEFTRFQASADLKAKLSTHLTAVAGAEFISENADSNGTIDIGFPLPTDYSVKRQQYSLFAELAARPVDGLELTVAGRHDAFEGDHERTVQATASYEVRGTGMVMFAGYAEGYRLPSLFALSFPLTANPDLLPERSTSLEAGFQYPLGRKGDLRLSWFRNRYRNLIDFDPEQFRMVNRDEVTIKGVELSASGEIRPGLSLQGSVACLDIDSDTALRGRPRLFGQGRLEWRANGRIRAGIEWQFNSQVWEVSVPTGVTELNGHVEAGVYANWQVSPHLVLGAVVRNLTGADYQNAVGFEEEGRTFRVRLTTRL